MILTQERLKELIHYDPNTGEFIWLVNRTNGVVAGDVAGTIQPNGYRYIGLDGKIYRAHRLAFLYIDGINPPDSVDHKDRVKDNNKWSNIKMCSHRENMSNTICNNKVVGICFDKSRNKYAAYFHHKRKKIRSGRFLTFKEACFARWQWELYFILNNEELV